MEPVESFSEATKCARSALKLMAEKRILPYPRNFTIWYAYFSGKYPDLSATLKKFLDKKDYFTEDRNTLIYQRFFGFDQLGQAVRQITAEASAALNSASKNVKELCNETKGAREDIQACCSRLDKVGGTDEIRALINEMVIRVHQLDAASQEMEKRLNANYMKMAELHRSIEESQREAMTDALTGLSNRKLFDSCLRLACENPRKAASLCVILMDVDKLGEYNDAYGFNSGDETLKAIARALSETVKGRDLAARFGDDEFAVLTVRTLLLDATKLARSLRGSAGIGNRAMDIGGENGMEHRVTLSIGVAQFEPGEPLNRFMERAKHALNAAKSNGRNQVVAVEKTSTGLVFWDEDQVRLSPGSIS